MMALDPPGGSVGISRNTSVDPSEAAQRISIHLSNITLGEVLTKGNTSRELSDKVTDSKDSQSSDVNTGEAKGSGQGNSAAESVKSSISRASISSSASDESFSSSIFGIPNKPHKGNDPRWDAIQWVCARDGTLGLSHFRLLKRLGCGDIGSVYLAELSGSKCHFAMKVMDKGALAGRKKLLRAQTEREILASLDHPFLPTLYAHFETEKFSCLVMEFCPGGDLHTLRQQQAGKHFSEVAARYVNSKAESCVV